MASLLNNRNTGTEILKIKVFGAMKAMAVKKGNNYVYYCVKIKRSHCDTVTVPSGIR
jgi:hypothetical protein